MKLAFGTHLYFPTSLYIGMFVQEFLHLRHFNRFIWINMIIISGNLKAYVIEIPCLKMKHGLTELFLQILLELSNVNSGLILNVPLNTKFVVLKICSSEKMCSAENVQCWKCAVLNMCSAENVHCWKCAVLKMGSAKRQNVQWSKKNTQFCFLQLNFITIMKIIPLQYFEKKGFRYVLSFLNYVILSATYKYKLFKCYAPKYVSLIIIREFDNFLVGMMYIT